MDPWNVKRPHPHCYLSQGRGISFSFYLTWVSPTKAPGTLRCPACLQGCPSLGGWGRQQAIVFFPFTHNLCFRLGLHLVNPILPFSFGWLPWLGAICTGKQGALLSGISPFSFSTAAVSVDKDFWHVVKDVASDLSTSVLSSICFYGISSILHCSL